jgi:protein O-GlcNAc transferase
LLKKGSFDEAIAMFRSALRVRPTSAEAYNQLGQALVANGDRDGADASFRKALQIDPSYSAARQNLQVGFNELSQKETTSAEPRGAAPPSANLPRAEEPTETENHPPLDSTENFDLMIQQGQLSMVEPRLVDFLRDHPDSSRAHYQLGYVWLRQRRISDSIREFSRSLQLNLNFADAHRLLGLDLSLIGRYEAAQLELQQSVRLEPNSAEAHYELGKICAAQDLWPQAAQEFKEAIRLNASYAEAYNALGFALDALNDDEAALSSYQKAIHLSEQRGRNFVAPYINLSAYYNRIGNADLALQYAQTAIKLDAKSDLAYFQMAKAFRFREEWSEAAEALRTAIAINSNSPQYFYILSTVETKLGHQKESQEAIRAFRKLEDDMASRAKLRRESLEGVFDRRNGETN